MTTSVIIGQSPIPAAPNLAGITLTGDQAGTTVNVELDDITGPYPLYTLTGYTATLPGSETATANYANVAAFEVAVVPTYSGQRCQIAGYPAAGAYNVLESRWNGTAFEWGIA